jgi:sterol desaturase/sphingolipid hydroxylase (fatty acid hydroxylase superfamily)
MASQCSGTASIQYGNIRLLDWLERWLQPVLVTVDMHRVHHSIVFGQANSNYGAVLSVWDRFFGTYTTSGCANCRGETA